MDKEAPGLMNLKPRSRDASIMTTGLLTTAGLVGLFMAVCTLALISYGTTHYGSVAIGTSMGVTAFSLLLIASAFEARSVTATALTIDTFDNRNLNWTALAELVLAVLITQMDVLRRLFGTVRAVAHAVGAGAGARRRALLPLGAREADRAPPDGLTPRRPPPSAADDHPTRRSPIPRCPVFQTQSGKISASDAGRGGRGSLCSPWS